MMVQTRTRDVSKQKAIQDLLSIAREKFVADLRVDVSVFDQPAWDVRALRDVERWINLYPPYTVRS